MVPFYCVEEKYYKIQEISYQDHKEGSSHERIKEHGGFRHDHSFAR